MCRAPGSVFSALSKGRRVIPGVSNFSEDFWKVAVPAKPVVGDLGEDHAGLMNIVEITRCFVEEKITESENLLLKDK